jgi:putative spermidine/putrescine transport system permease protein
MKRIALAVAVFAYGFLLAPFFVVAIASLEGSQAFFFNFPPRQLSLAWYGEIPVKYFHAFGVSLALGAVTAVSSGLIGTAAALGLVRGRVRRQPLVQAVFRLPLQIPFVVTGVVFLQAYYRLVDVVGVNLAGTLSGMIVAHVFVTIPYTVGAVSSVVVRMNPRLDEAAASLGATGWSTFWRVTFPLVRPGIFAGVLYAFIISFGDVPIAVFLAGSNTVTLPVEIFQSLQFDFNPAILALSTLVVIFSLVLVVLMQRVVGLDIVLRTSGSAH